MGHGGGDDARAKIGLPGKGPVAVISDLGVLVPDPATKELILQSVHSGVTVQQVVAATGWPLKLAPLIQTTPPPTESELSVLRDLNLRTARAHAGQA